MGAIVGTITDFMPEKLIIGVLSSLPDRFVRVEPQLREEFGAIDYSSEELAFTYTTYYDDEMGTPIFRKFYAFREPIDPQRLASVKRRSNKLEGVWGEAGHRRINLDPGLLGLGRLILASTKGPGHRIPLSEGIYAEVTLFFRAGSYQALPWTYPDFRSEAYQKILKDIRAMYHKQLKELGFSVS